MVWCGMVWYGVVVVGNYHCSQDGGRMSSATFLANLRVRIVCTTMQRRSFVAVFGSNVLAVE
jgi:hypothetical protein